MSHELLINIRFEEFNGEWHADIQDNDEFHHLGADCPEELMKLVSLALNNSIKSRACAVWLENKIKELKK